MLELAVGHSNVDDYVGEAGKLAVTALLRSVEGRQVSRRRSAFCTNTTRQIMEHLVRLMNHA